MKRLLCRYQERTIKKSEYSQIVNPDKCFMLGACFTYDLHPCECCCLDWLLREPFWQSPKRQGFKFTCELSCDSLQVLHGMFFKPEEVFQSIFTVWLTSWCIYFKYYLTSVLITFQTLNTDFFILLSYITYKLSTPLTQFSEHSSR